MSAPVLVAPMAAPNPWFSWTYLSSNVDDLLLAGREHILITIAAVVLATAVAVPLTLVVRRFPRLQVPVLAFSGLLYTIPSLALIAGLWPWLGLSPWTVITALALYALLVILRNMLVGLDAVPAELVDAAKGVGYTKSQLLWRIQVPLATPAIMAGIRIATVSTIGL